MFLKLKLTAKVGVGVGCSVFQLPLAFLLTFHSFTFTPRSTNNSLPLVSAGKLTPNKSNSSDAPHSYDDGARESGRDGRKVHKVTNIRLLSAGIRFPLFGRHNHQSIYY